MAETSAKSGRGLVVSGGILSGLSLVMTGAAVVYFIVGIQGGPEAMSLIFPFLLLGWLTIAGATWVFYPLIAAIPLSIVAMIGGLAWLVWGKPSHAM